ncbi:MAG: TylF/MycF family methyltransferase [Desulfovibrio sp.]|jgi:hypothetical protein|nr:TylF/MycF family methyltransferase [Desulfovibrio sp.]
MGFFFREKKTPPPCSSFGDAVEAYNRWAWQHINNNQNSPTNQLSISADPSSPQATAIMHAALEYEMGIVEQLLKTIQEKNVPGAIIEFGVFKGDNLKCIIDICDKILLQRDIYGFDSFEGLPAVHPDHDLQCWHKGQYVADFHSVEKRLNADKRHNINIIQGWFKDSLAQEQALCIKEVAYARIDCDLYQPAVECLEYLTSRLVDNSILVFDDWTYDLNKGETKAFVEWKERNKQFQFDFIFYGVMGHLYMRVTRN